MQLLKRLFNFYVFSNIHVAVGAFFFVKITLMSFSIQENETGLFVFFSTIVSYNFIRLLNIPEHKNWITIWFVKHKKAIIILSIVCCIACVYFATDFNSNAIVVLIPFIILTLFYGMPLPNRLFSLRKIPGLKILVIAFCFAGVTVIFPLVQNSIKISSIIGVLFIQRLLFVILITIPFDIRDVDFDNSKLKTIPQYFGIISAKLIGVFLGVIIVLIDFIFLFENQITSYIVMIVTSVSVILLLFSNNKQPKYYSTFWVESIPIVWYVLLFISLNM